MPFDYASFRAQYAAKLHNQHAKRSRRADHNDARKDANFRPLEYLATLRDYARTGRVTLTHQEKCVLYYDKRFLELADDPEMTGETMTELRLGWIADHANCDPDTVIRLLERIEEVIWRASLLDIDVDTEYTITPRQKAELQF